MVNASEVKNPRAGAFLTSTAETSASHTPGSQILSCLHDPVHIDQKVSPQSLPGKLKKEQWKKIVRRHLPR